jgi:ComEC/Rec2-related protein
MAAAAISGIVFAEFFACSSALLLALVVAGILGAFTRYGTSPLLVATAAAFALVHDWQWNQSPARDWAETLTASPRYVEVHGLLVDEPTEVLRNEKPTGIWRARMRVERWVTEGPSIKKPATIIVRWAPSEKPAYGDRWILCGEVRLLPSPRNPGEFDARSFYDRQGIYLELRDDGSARLKGRGQGHAIKAAAIASRAWIINTLGLGLANDEQVRAVIAGITLGVRDDAAEELLPAFRQTGTLHLFAVSGLHVGMFGLLLWLVLRPLGFSRRQSVLIIVPLLFFYALVTGAKPSSLRAATMISLALGGFLLDRPASTANSLAAAALVLLGYDTNQLFLPGFQLSFLVVASILLLAPTFDRVLAARLQPDVFLPRRLYTKRQEWQAAVGRSTAAMLAVSTASWLGSLPLTVLFFHLVPLVAIPANLLAVPLAFLILAVALLAITGGLLSFWLAAVFNQTNWALTSILLAGIQSAALLPGAWLPFPPGWTQPPARVTVFDLSSGGGILLRTPESAWLLDTGSEYDFTRVILPNLQAAGAGQVDALLVTHGDSEHIGGAVDALQEVLPRRVLDSVLRDRSSARRHLHDALQSGNKPKSLVLPGDRFLAGKNTTITIFPPAPGDRARTADDQTIPTKIQTGDFFILCMSDSGVTTEQRLLAGYRHSLSSDVLILGRHGDDLFATGEFLRAVGPRVIILAATDPFEDHEGEEALRTRLTATGATLFDQEESGAVIITRQGNSLEIRAFLTAQSEKLKKR